MTSIYFSKISQCFLDSLAQYPELKHAIVLDVRGQVLAHSDSTRRGLYLNDLPKEVKPKVLQHGPVFIDVASPVMLSGKHIGWVRIGLAGKALDAKLTEMMWRGINYALGGIVLSTLIAVLTGSYLTRRLYIIQKVANAVQAGELELRAEVSGDDEAAQLARHFNNMLDTLAQRTTELISANHELESFAYAVSHDLRAPLRAMSGFSHVLVEDYGDKLEGDAKIILNQIDIASRNMGKLIDGILMLARCTRGEIKQDSIDISALATQILEELTHNEPERKVEWHVEPNLSATGDASMTELVLRNLLCNAWKYTGKTNAAVIRVFWGEIDSKQGFCIADNGAGFDTAQIERLFKPFQRLHRQEEFPGLGIGLATVQRIVNRHGGKIYAKGQVGNGATFCFTLPQFREANRK